jgi:Ca2+-binding RTX toxin-like protein
MEREVSSATSARPLMSLCLVSLALGFTGLAVAAASASADPVIAAAGDIACDGSSPYFNGGRGTATRCRQKYTSDLLVGAGLTAVLPLGDAQYHTASLPDFRVSYDPSWGRVRPISHPVAGNHEFTQNGSPVAKGYYDYFNGAGASFGPAGDRTAGYYSFDVGAWHLIALNSNCASIDRGAAPDGCAAGSPQELWLRADLAAHPTGCTLAYWHHPRFSSGFEGDSEQMQSFWLDLYNAGADVALAAHHHDYERFAPQDAAGRHDPVTGVREFVVGTGGAFFTGLRAAKPNSEVRQNHTYGILRLTLHPTGYDWSFQPEAGKAFTDAGTELCHGPPGQPQVLSQGPHRCTIVGTAGNDALSGTLRNDVICGLGGNDTIRGRGGDDVVRGGEGQDRVRGGRGRDRIYGSSGNDILHGQGGNDRVRGGAGRDRLYGDAGNDVLRGQRGRDSLRAGRGRDRLYGGAGDDRLSSLDRRPGDRVDGGKGHDRASINDGDQVRFLERVLASRG